jgi:hypothetical protein
MIPSVIRPHLAWRPARFRPAIGQATGPLDILAGHVALVLGDIDNLRLGARDVGARLSFARLGRCFKRLSVRSQLHAFLPKEGANDARCRELQQCGWLTHAREVEWVQTRQGLKSESNCDNDLIFAGAVLALRRRPGLPLAVVIGSGDGALVSDLARLLKKLPRPPLVVTCSVPGSTSRRVLTNPNIDANINVGLDVLDEERSCWTSC